jgi:hypothetical protein
VTMVGIYGITEQEMNARRKAATLGGEECVGCRTFVPTDTSHSCTRVVGYVSHTIRIGNDTALELAALGEELKAIRVLLEKLVAKGEPIAVEKTAPRKLPRRNPQIAG